MDQKAYIGDVFLVPIDETRIGIGQIAGDWKGEIYVVIYDAVYGDENVDPESVIVAKPLFAALSLDAKIHHGDWKIIGNITENPSSIPQPVFKVNHAGKIFLISRDRTVFRPASASEEKYL